MEESGQIIYDAVQSEKKELVEINGNHHHCIVDSRTQYIDKIHKFIKETS